MPFTRSLPSQHPSQHHQQAASPARCPQLPTHQCHVLGTDRHALHVLCLALDVHQEGNDGRVALHGGMAVGMVGGWRCTVAGQELHTRQLWQAKAVKGAAMASPVLLPSALSRTCISLMTRLMLRCTPSMTIDCLRAS